MTLLDFLNRKKQTEKPEVMPVLPKDIYRQGALDLTDTIAPTALKVSAREIELGEKFARSFYTISYPRYLSDGWFTPVINLDQVFDAAIFIHPIDTADALRKFQKKVAEVQSQIAEREEKGLVRDPMLDTAYRDLEELRDRLQQAEEKLFDVGLYLTLYGDSKEEIDKIEGQVRGILASDRGILYGINRHNSSLILFDRFSLENYNSVVFAKSGSGKSYAVKLEI